MGGVYGCNQKSVHSLNKISSLYLRASLHGVDMFTVINPKMKNREVYDLTTI
jgi:hypothetical protein